MPKYIIHYKLSPSKQSDDPKVAYEEMKVAMSRADELTEAGIFKHHWSTAPASGVIIAKLPSFEEAYKLGNRFWPSISMKIQEIITWDKVKEIALSQAKEVAER
jgi:hypothetical protein